METRLFIHVYVSLFSGVMRRDWRIVIMTRGHSTTVNTMLMLQSHAVSQPLFRLVWLYFRRSYLLIKFFLELVTVMSYHFSIWGNTIYICVCMYIHIQCGFHIGKQLAMEADCHILWVSIYIYIYIYTYTYINTHNQTSVYNVWQQLHWVAVQLP